MKHRSARPSSCWCWRGGCLAALLAIAALAFAQSPQPETQPEAPKFDILEFQVEGATTLPTLQIEKAVYPFLGYGKTVADVEAARQALEKAFHDAGYLTVLVDIPEQQVEGGLVTLRVVEGKVSRLAVRGNKYYSRGYIRSQAPELAEGTVPNFPNVQRQLADLNRNPNLRITPVLKPGPAPGTVDVELQADDKRPYGFEVELNNRYSPNTDPLRLQASFHYDNLWQRMHSIYLLAQTSPQDTSQVKVFSAVYTMPLGRNGDSLALYAVDSQSNVAAVGDVTVLGQGSIFGARAAFPLPPRADYYHSLTLGVDYKDFGEDVAAAGSDPFSTPVKYIPFLVQYAGGLTWGDRQTQGTLGLNFAPRGLIENDDVEFENKRFNASSSYVYLRWDLRHVEPLPKKLALVARLQGQVASQALISNEEFAAGGLGTVRGYLEAEQTGDNAFLASAELQSWNLASADSKALTLLTLVGFVDFGQLWIYDALPGQVSRVSMTSVGVGLRLHAWKYLTATLDLGVPLDSTQYTQAGSPRLTFVLVGSL